MRRNFGERGGGDGRVLDGDDERDGRGSGAERVEGDLARLIVVEHGEVGRGESFDVAAFGVGDADGHLYDAGLDAERLVLGESGNRAENGQVGSACPTSL